MISRCFAAAKAECSAWGWSFAEGLPGLIGIYARRIALRAILARAGARLIVWPRCSFFGPEGIELGHNVAIFSNSCFASAAGGQLRIGDNVSFNRNSFVDASSGVVHIGDDCLFGPNVVIRSSNHRHSNVDIPIRKQGHVPGKIIIGNDVWVGANVVILPDVTIGKGCIVGAGAVVTASLPDNAIAVGVPARIMRQRSNRDVI